MNWGEDETVGEGDETAVGTLTLSSDDLWSDLRTGSIITFIETVDGGGAGNFDTLTDVSYDPLNDDWWINISTQGEAAKEAGAFVTTTTNDGLVGDFSVVDWVAESKLIRVYGNAIGLTAQGSVDIRNDMMDVQELLNFWSQF